MVSSNENVPAQGQSASILLLGWYDDFSSLEPIHAEPILMMDDSTEQGNDKNQGEEAGKEPSIQPDTVRPDVELISDTNAPSMTPEVSSKRKANVNKKKANEKNKKTNEKRKKDIDAQVEVIDIDDESANQNRSKKGSGPKPRQWRLWRQRGCMKSSFRNASMTKSSKQDAQPTESSPMEVEKGSKAKKVCTKHTEAATGSMKDVTEPEWWKI